MVEAIQDQWAIVAGVTETKGPLADQRVVRGQEAECRELYAKPAHRETKR